MVPQSQNVPPKPGAEIVGSFNLQSATKVIQTHNQSEILKQNNGMTDGNEMPTLLMDLLKDPTVTVSYLKNIFMLEELYKLLPVNNKTVTADIGDILNTLLLRPEELPGEMRNQLSGSTAFSGELFDLLRQIGSQNKERSDIQISIARFLRSLNGMGSQREILDSLANNFSFLRGQLAASRSLSGRLDALIAGFRAESAPQNFSALKAEALALINNIEESILFSPPIGKILSILVYNLSRYNANTDYAVEAAYRLAQYLPPAQAAELRRLVQEFFNAQLAPQLAAEETAPEEEVSRVMSTLIALISQQTERSANPADAAKLERMLHSLLSSPCNFTPLLHFILPLRYNDTRAFAELWINPDSDEHDMPEGTAPGIHFLMVVDVEHVGRFEAEFFVYNSTIDFKLYCPKGSEAGYEGLMKSFPKLLYGTPYHVGKTELLPFESTRSLMDVFKSLPYRRVGVDVKI